MSLFHKTILDEIRTRVIMQNSLENRKIREYTEARNKLNKLDVKRKYYGNMIYFCEGNKKRLEDMKYFIDKFLKKAYKGTIPHDVEETLKAVRAHLAIAETHPDQSRTEINRAFVLLENLKNSVMARRAA